MRLETFNYQKSIETWMNKVSFKTSTRQMIMTQISQYEKIHKNIVANSSINDYLQEIECCVKENGDSRIYECQTYGEEKTH